MLKNRDAVDFFRDAFGRILIIIGLFSFILGLLYLSPMGSLAAALGLFFGVFFIDIGFVVHFELFKVKVRSKEGLSTLLIGIAPLLIISGVIFVLFAEPDWSRGYILPPHKMGFPINYRGPLTVLAPLIRIYMWLAIPLAIVGVILLVVGFLLRIYDALF